MHWPNAKSNQVRQSGLIQKIQEGDQIRKEWNATTRSGNIGGGEWLLKRR